MATRVRGSTSEKVFADIDGVRQGMFIQSKDAAHPVLLYLHGGLPTARLRHVSNMSPQAPRS